MSVIIQLSLSRTEFALGRILPLLEDVEYSLEPIIPLGESPVPFIRVHDGQSETLVDEVIDHPSVREMTLQTTEGDEEVFSLDWDYSDDRFLTAVHECDGHVLSGDSYAGEWQFTLQFPDHESVSTFEEKLRDTEIEDQVLSIHNPWTPGQETGAGLTDAQREALTLAYQNAYYDIPRRTSTKELADTLGISDQALSERLRRGTARMIASMLMVTAEPDSQG